MNTKSRIWVAGATGLVGSALVRKLKAQGYTNILTKRVDLRGRRETLSLFREYAPEYVFLAAAKVGGIGYNAANPALMISDNLAIQNNVIDLSLSFGVKKLVFLGSACIYPKIAPQPIKEDYLLTGPLEPTNDAYAIAKIAGIKMCQAYRDQHGMNAISLMPANLFGPGDNYKPGHSHVIPALISKFSYAKRTNQETVTLLGDGSPTREFMYSDDFADACIYLMNNYESREIINVGSDYCISIKELANKIKDLTDFRGEIIWDTNQPNGTPLRKLDNQKLRKEGWSKIVGDEEFNEQLKQTIKEYKETGY